MSKITSFEQKLKKSKELLEKLMNPEISLEDSMKFYKEGMKELEEATKLLEDAKLVCKEYEE